MGVATALIAGAAITAAGSAVAGNQKKVAANKAADAQAKALEAQKGIDITKVSADAKAADLQKYKDQFSALAQVDPTTAGIRDASNAGLLKSANGDTNSANANSLLSTLFAENNNLNPADADFQAKLKAKAQEQLDLGGKLSPEAQAEFVGAGLEKAAGSGFDAGSSATKQGVGKLLFSESNALEQQRANMAKELFGFATDLSTQRNNNLLNISNASAKTSTLDQAKLLNLAALADSRAPSIGLSGASVANLAVANTQQQNANALAAGNIAAAKATAAGQQTAGIINGITSVASAGVNAYGNYLGGTQNFLKNNPAA